MRLPLILAVAALSAAPSPAAETAWQEVAPGVRLRLISSDVLRPDGTTTVGLEVDMPENTKTYWRIPGETGIATELDTSGSHGVGAHVIDWPYPKGERVAGYFDYVYYGPTVLPVDVAVAGDAPLLKVAVTMGICSDICIPAMADFSLPLDFGKPDAAQQIRLRQADAETPLEWSGPDSPFGAVTFDPLAEMLVVEVIDPAVDPASLIADMGEGGALFGAPQKSPQAGVVHIPLLGGSETGNWEGQPVQLTFLTRDGPYETSVRIAPLVSTTAAP